MAGHIRIAILGGGWPGQMHAKAMSAAGGFKVVAVADLIPARRAALAAGHAGAKEYAEAGALLTDKSLELDAVSICLPNHLHVEHAIAALRAERHVVCETPPALNSKQARQIAAAVAKSGRVLLYGFQRRFGGPEQAARQAIEKGYAGEIYHARAAWTRTRGVPVGTGWYADKTKSGGGGLLDLGLPMFDLAWHLMGQPKPLSVTAAIHARLGSNPESVEEAGFALVRFEGGKSLELAASWAINQPPQQQGTVCRLHGTNGAVDVYTTGGAMLYRGFDEKGISKATALKAPKTVNYPALMRHFRDCVAGKAQPNPGPQDGVLAMQVMEAIYRSAASRKSQAIN